MPRWKEWLSMDSGSVPRRQPWVPGYRIKIGVPIRFLSIKLLQAFYPSTLVFADIHVNLGRRLSGFPRVKVTSLRPINGSSILYESMLYFVWIYQFATGFILYPCIHLNHQHRKEKHLSTGPPSLARARTVSRRSGWTSPKRKKKKEKSIWAVSRAPKSLVHTAQ